MGYRKIEKKKPIKRVLQDVTTQNRTFIQNGAHAHIAIPCWYMEIRHPQHTYIHDREWHDHIGWPTPTNPDHSSQDAYHIKGAPYQYDTARGGWRNIFRYLDMSQCHPIHLLKEGYKTVEIAFANKPEGLNASGYIDPNQDWVVRFDINPMCDSAIEEDIDVPYTVFVNGNFGTRKVRDVVAKGILRIVAGPIS